MSSFTCISCRLAFNNTDVQRQHYKSEWHRYNLKRKVAEIPPITLEEFELKVLKERLLDAKNAKIERIYCMSCKKNFSTTKSYENHLNSKKHKENLLKNNDEKSIIASRLKEIKIKSTNDELVTSLPEDFDSDIETDSEIEEVSSDEWNEDDMENPINKNDCLFCNHHSGNLVQNLKHMSETHSFFLPDLEYCCDLKGLLLHLGAKVFYGHICLWCNGKSFQSVKAVQKHMIDKGHTNILHEGETLLEFTPFYDYSPSYPDNEEGKDPNEEVVIPVIDDTEYQLVLPSGSVIGHRSLMRYYKQNLDPKKGVLLQSKIKQVLKTYKQMGYNPIEKEQIQRKARDIKFMTRIQQKFSMHLGCKANKLQKHFRPQVNF